VRLDEGCWENHHGKHSHASPAEDGPLWA